MTSRKKAATGTLTCEHVYHIQYPIDKMVTGTRTKNTGTFTFETITEEEGKGYKVTVKHYDNTSD